MDNLFEMFVRDRQGPSNHNENPYDYYNESARKDVEIIRNTLNAWFSDYPTSERKDLKNRFKKEFDSAFYELFLHQFFQKLGFTITIHPTLQHSSKHPDFLIKRDELEIYIEARVLTGKSALEKADDRKVNEFYDNLNKIRTDNYILQVEELVFFTKQQPSTKEVIIYIENQLKSLDPDNISCIDNLDALPCIQYSNSDFSIKVKPIPMVETARGKKKRPIGMYPYVSFMDGGEESLKDAIENKAKRYGKLDKPYLVCVNSLDYKTSSKEDVDNAVWGSLALSYSEDPDNRDERWIRMPNGVFYNGNRKRLINLSGVLVSKIYPHNVPVGEYWIYKHPFSQNAMDFEDLGLTYNYVDKENKIVTNKINKDISDILGISKSWLSSS